MAEPVGRLEADGFLVDRVPVNTEGLADAEQNGLKVYRLARDLPP